MTHPLEDLTALLDGALAPPREAEVREHLARCPGCRAEEARLRQALALLSRLPPARELPPFFATRLEARLREEQARARTPAGLRWLSGLALPRRRALVLAGGLAAAALMAAVPARSYLETRRMVRDLDLLQDYETASAVDVDTPEDALIVAQLDALTAGEGRP